MAAGTAILVDEYLRTTHHPDRDYVDGEVQERHSGTFDHSALQVALTLQLSRWMGQLALRPLTEMRVKVGPRAYRVPDVCLVRTDQPPEQVLTTPPLACFEILSPDDTLQGTLDRCGDYLALGVPHVWIIDPEKRRVFQATNTGLHLVTGGTLRSSNPGLTISLDELFSALD